MQPALFGSFIDNSGSTAIPVLFLHGFGGTGLQWWGLQTAVSFKAPTLAYDMPGHGKSLAFPDAGPPKIAARAVLADTSARGINRFHLVGHSMGGAISALVGLMAPDKVASMTLLAPGGFGPKFNYPILQKWAAAKTESQLRAALPAMFGPSFEIPDKLVDYLVDVREIPGAVPKLISIMKGMSVDGQQGQLPVDDLISAGVPISVVWGDQDMIVPVAQTEQLKGRVDLHILEGIGHSPADECPDLVRKVILDNLARA